MSSRIRVLALTMMLVLLFGPAHTYASVLGWPTVSVGASAAWPGGISDSRVAWDSAAGGGHQIMTWGFDGSAPKAVGPQFLTSISDNLGVEVSGDRVAWALSENPGGDRVYTWRSGETSPTPLFASTWGPLAVDVSGDRVAWVGPTGYDSTAVFTWKSGDATATQLTPDDHAWWYWIAEDRAGAVSGDRVVWCRRWNLAVPPSMPDELFTWKAGDVTPTVIPTIGYEVLWGRDSVSGDRVAWTGKVGAYHQVFTWKVGDSGPTQITHDAHEHTSVWVSGDRLAWLQYVPSADRVAVQTCRVGDPNVTQMAPYANDGEFDLALVGDRLVWQGGYRIGLINDFSSIFTWTQGDTGPTLLTANGVGFALSENRIAWADSSTGAIVVAHRAPVATSVTAPALSTSSLSVGSTVSITSNVSPRASASTGASFVSLYHYETVTVKVPASGSTRTKRVQKWVLRSKVRMKALSSGRLSWKGKVTKRGLWRVTVTYAGASNCKSSKSSTRSFRVR